MARYRHAVTPDSKLPCPGLSDVYCSCGGLPFALLSFSLSSSLSLSPPFSCCQLCRYCMGHGPSCYRAFLVQLSVHWCARRWINPWRCAHTGIETVLRLGWSSPSPPPPPPLGRLVLVWLQALPHWARLTVPCPRFLTILFCVSRMGPWTAWRPPRNPPSHAVAQFRCGDMQCLTVRSSFAVEKEKILLLLLPS